MPSFHRFGQSTETIPLLDVTRILAAWMVLAWHTGYYVGYRMPVFGSAAVAVDVFMNVSGFLMLYHYWERREKEPWHEPLTWWRFYIRRFFRITPLYYAILLFLIVSGWISNPKNPISGASPVWQWLLLRVSFIFGFIPAEATHCAVPDWSLTLEMQFYALFPFLALAMRRLGPGLFFFLCSLLGAVCRFSIGYYDDAKPGLLLYFPQPSILPLKLHIFAVGMVVAWVLIRGPTELKSKWFLAAFPLYLLTCKENYLWLMAVVYWTGYAAACLPAIRPRFFNLMQAGNQLLEKLPLRKTLADCSYGTYLIHSLVISLALSRIWAQGNLGQGSLRQFVPVFVLTLVLTTIISWLLHWSIGQPGINWGKTVIRKFAVRRPG
jgi:peptidoglycan/LPS O-acetylase OafA/YrhL